MNDTVWCISRKKGNSGLSQQVAPCSCSVFVFFIIIFTSQPSSWELLPSTMIWYFICVWTSQGHRCRPSPPLVFGIYFDRVWRAFPIPSGSHVDVNRFSTNSRTRTFGGGTNGKNYEYARGKRFLVCAYGRHSNATFAHRQFSSTAAVPSIGCQDYHIIAC